MKQALFVFNKTQYQFAYDPTDLSGQGCLTEIVQRNDYGLDQFVGLQTNILDIGANCGVATIILAKQNPLSTIFSFEPSPKTFAVLSENVRLNNLTNVKLYQIALSKPNVKNLQLTISPNETGASSTYAQSTKFTIKQKLKRSAPIVTVPCMSLDDFIAQTNIDNIGLLKIDCEGAEYDTLYHFTKIQMIKNIVGEFHNLSYHSNPEYSGSGAAEKLINYCKANISGMCKISILTI